MRFAAIPMAFLTGHALAGPKAVTTPSSGPYTFTGTATVLGGGSNCVANSPAPITGDAIVTASGYGFDLHIKSSTDVAAVAIQFKGNGEPIVQYGLTSTGPISYLLLPNTSTLSGTYTALATRVNKISFTEAITIDSGSFIIGKAGKCQIGLALTLTSGVDKALLKLLNGVL